MNGLAEIAKVFLKLCTIGFGGPAAHIGLMENEVLVISWHYSDIFKRLLRNEIRHT